MTKIAIPNPRTSPLGKYTEEVLNYYNLKKDVEGRIVYVETVRQSVDYLLREEVDAAFLYANEVHQTKDTISVAYSIDERTHSSVVFPLSVLKDALNAHTAVKFVDFLVSAKGREVVKKHGFELP